MNTLIGKPIDRVDGRLKVTGAARYAAEAPVQGVAHAWLVQSTIAKGHITAIDTTAAEAAPGVIVVVTSKNMPKLTQPKEDFMQGGKLGEDRLPLHDDEIFYAGQHVAVVVADTPERARAAARLVKVTYAQEKPLLEMADAGSTATRPVQFFGEPLQYKRGDVDHALVAANLVKVTQTYTTPAQTHNPMEPSATVAAWDGDRLTVYDATQWIMGTQAILAEAFGIPRQSVRVMCPFVGGGFGCKGFIWGHTILAAAAAKLANRPVKLSLTRAQMFTSVGHRTPTVQKLTLAASKDGKLAAMRHETLVESSPITEFVESCGTATTRLLYACDHVETPHTLVRVNKATPTPMRAPGECPGTFALESAMDELAYALKIDPVQLRLINHADTNLAKNLPWSSKHLKECYSRGAEAFGWAKRNPEPGSMRDGNLLVGWGMATATYPGFRWAAAAKVKLFAEGRAVVSSATHDLGTGAYTVFTQIAAEALGLPIEKVKFELGDSNLPFAPVAGGSNSTATVSQAILDAVTALATKLGVKDGPATLDALQKSGKQAAEADSVSHPGAEIQQYAFQSFGAQYCEVKIDPQLPRVHVTRFVSAIDNGRIINHKTARSQVMGGTIMGIGMALLEDTVYDPRTGRPVTDSLADYAVPVNADIGSIEPQFIDEPDPYINALGCRGVGEIGITGVAAAVANAVYHATGKRVRDLPITADKLL